MRKTTNPLSLTQGTVALVAWIASLSSSRADVVPPLDDIRQRYAEMRQQLSELSVKWTMMHHLLVDKDRAKRMDKLGSNYNRETFSRVTVHTAFKAGKRFYDQSFEPMFGDTLPVDEKRRVMASDGQVTRMRNELKPNAKRPNPGFIDRGDNLDQWTANDSFMCYHGLQTSWFRLFISDDCKKWANVQLDKELLSPPYHVEPALRPAADGVPCVVVSSDDDRLWFDPTLKLALRQRQWTGPGKRGIVTQLRLSNHTEVRPGLWMARRIDRDYFCDPAKAPDFAGKPYRTETLEVSEFQIHDVPDDLFSFTFPPGYFISDTTLLEDVGDGGLTVNYFIPTNLEDLPRIVERATQRERELYLHRPSRHFIRMIAGGVGVAVVVLVWIVVAWRRRWSVHT